MHLFKQKTVHHYFAGKRVLSKTPGAEARTVESKKWYINLPRHGGGKPIPTPLHADKSVAMKMAVKLLARFEAGPDAKKQRERNEARKTPLSAHLETFMAELSVTRNGKGGRPPSERQLKQNRRNLNQVISACEWEYPEDMTLISIQAGLHDLSQDGEIDELDKENYTLGEVCAITGRHHNTILWIIKKYRLDYSGEIPHRRYPAETLRRLLLNRRESKGLSSRTIQILAGQARRFAAWVQKRCGLEYTLEDLRCRQGDDARHARRTLSDTEVERLLRTTLAGSRVFRDLTPEDRHALYLTALTTGFRVGELAALLPEWFVFEPGKNTVSLPASIAKNGKASTQPIPPDAAEILQAYLQGKPARTPLWPGSWRTSTASMLLPDLEAAGIAYTIDGPDGLLYADFHSFRHTFIALLDRAGLTLKQAMQLARHSDPRLTARVYGKANLDELSQAVSRVSLGKKT